MAQQHLDRLTATDASFLANEGHASHMHVGAITTFEGPPPSYQDFLDQIRSRLHLVPRYRQKLFTPPLETGRPMWADDPSFNLEYHVRHTALPEPGDEHQLLLLAARVFSQRLDRSKPLWETWFVEGLEGNRFALISKTHHALIDGIAGVDLATVLFDLSPVPPEVPTDGEEWTPTPEPGAADLVAAGVRALVGSGTEIAARAVSAATRPETTLRRVREAVEGVGEILWAGLNPAPETPLNVEIGPHRRLAVVRNDLEDYKTIKDALGGTVNDVVLTVVAGALRRWLHSRGVRTEGMELRGLVPVSIRGEDERGQLGNRIAAMRGPLPVYIADPVARLRFVKQAMDGLKESKQALGAEVIAGVNNFAPPTILAQASRINFSTRLFNLIVTNVPGPQFPLYVLGRELQDLFPVAFLPEQHALAIAIMSYNGKLNFGLLADFDTLPDLDVIVAGLDEARDELLEAARRQGGAAKRPRAEQPA
ncbi:MAG: diacylglycerol O-acyltransferase / wax synthase [Solirubrobacteraceae bacterium]|nr:diacylglycerol O-acyltransferase / wax synthase [Solirubrobacteraceae bacterium]